jgi:hypothetical protein
MPPNPNTNTAPTSTHPMHFDSPSHNSSLIATCIPHPTHTHPPTHTHIPTLIVWETPGVGRGQIYGVPQYMEMYSHMLGYPDILECMSIYGGLQYMGRHSNIWACVPTYGGAPVYRNTFPYPGVAHYMGMYSHIRWYTSTWECIPMSVILGCPNIWECIPTYGDTSVCGNTLSIWECVPIYGDAPIYRNTFP